MTTPSIDQQRGHRDDAKIATGHFEAEREAATSRAFAASVRGDANPRFNVTAAGGITMGDGTNAPDVGIERTSDGNLRFNDGTVGGVATLDRVDLGPDGFIIVNNTNANNVALQTVVTPNSEPSGRISADGRYSWGSGSAALDTILQRTGVGELTLTDDLVVNGTIDADEQSSESRFRVGAADSFNRRQLEYYASNDSDPDGTGAGYSGDGSILRLGNLTADGDAINVISEGAVFYGQATGVGAMTSTDFAFARIKPTRFQLREALSSTQRNIFRVDDNSLEWRASGGASDTLNLTTTRMEVNTRIDANGDGTHVLQVAEDNTDPTSGGGAATGRIPILVNGNLRYIAYYT